MKRGRIRYKVEYEERYFLWHCRSRINIWPASSLAEYSPPTTEARVLPPAVTSLVKSLYNLLYHVYTIQFTDPAFYNLSHSAI